MQYRTAHFRRIYDPLGEISYGFWGREFISYRRFLFFLAAFHRNPNNPADPIKILKTIVLMSSHQLHTLKAP